MKVRLAYGREGLEVELPDERTTVIEPTFVPGLPDAKGAILTALRNPIGTPPLRQIVEPTQSVAISVCDITRPMPSKTLLPLLLGELRHVPPENITILIATGTHRTNTEEELAEMLGEGVVDKYRVVNHNGFDDDSPEKIGSTDSGIEVLLNRRWVESDIRITTGFVEPHFFAGFSGGPKMVAPGLAGFPTIMRLHDAAMIGHPNARFAITVGNPIHDAIREIARMSSVDFSVDVTINRDKRITSVYAGELFAVHKAACAVAQRLAMQPVSAPFDLVLTTNSGYPLDQNLYQAVKGMSAAAQVVREGGRIICAAECSEGVPEHGQYRDILALCGSPSEVLEMIQQTEYERHDQWQAQIQAQIQMKADVYLKSSCLTEQQVTDAHLTPVGRIEDTIEDCGPDASICVLPEGPQTIPYISAG
ncbi:MAG: nickel-dependent lactate racemase [Chloroflexi bacterium]|nr:nickel-dependent lactate racemase [Chloroflexota bacterium]